MPSYDTLFERRFARGEPPPTGSIRVPGAAEPAVAQSFSMVPPEKRQLLVVEDSEDHRRILRDGLINAGFDVMEAADGKTGIAVAVSKRPDLIFMGLQLPDMDGTDAIRWLKSDPDLRRIPVIAVTSYALSGEQERSRAAGCDGYVSKPISPTHLLEVVRSFLSDR